MRTGGNFSITRIIMFHRLSLREVLLRSFPIVMKQNHRLRLRIPYEGLSYPSIRVVS